MAQKEGNKPFWWFSTNFALNLALLVGGLFAMLQPDEIRNAVGAAVSLVSFVGIARQAVKSVNVKRWLMDTNTWVYLASIVMTFLPSLPIELFTSLGDAISAMLGGNYQAAVLALFTFVNILYKIITTPKPQP